MKPCESIKMLLPLYQSGDLPDNEIELVKKHLNGCHECKKVLDELNHIVTAIHHVDKVPDENYGSYLVTEIHKKLDKKPTVWNWLWKTVPAIGAAAVVAFIYISPNSSNFKHEQMYSDLTILSHLTHSGYLNSTSELDYYLADNSDINLVNEEYIAQAEAYILDQTSSNSDDYYNTLIADLDDTQFSLVIENLKNMKL